MTHEVREHGEAEGGPEHDPSLPDALAVPVHDNPEDSDGPELGDDSPTGDAPPLPTWSDTTGEV